jgi:hypothetical protein
MHGTDAGIEGKIFRVIDKALHLILQANSGWYGFFKLTK